MTDGKVEAGSVDTELSWSNFRVSFSGNGGTPGRSGDVLAPRSNSPDSSDDLGVQTKASSSSVRIS